MVATLRAGHRIPVDEARVTGDKIERALVLTCDPEPRVRQAALANMCPCHVQADRPEVWQRVFELAADPDRDVRRQVLHTLGDGSPRRLEGRVIATLESMRQDADSRLRRRVRRLLAQYRRTGRINVL